MDATPRARFPRPLALTLVLLASFADQSKRAQPYRYFTLPTAASASYTPASLPVSLLHWSGNEKPWDRLDTGRSCPLDAVWAKYDLLRLRLAAGIEST
jgi:hypothetical protein